MILKLLLKLVFLCTCKYNSVQGIVAPQLHEVHGVAESEAGMTAEYYARLSIVIAESFGVRGRIMFQSGVLHEESVWKRFLWKINFVLLICRQPRSTKHNNEQNKRKRDRRSSQCIAFIDHTIRRGCSSKPRTSPPPAR